MADQSHQTRYLNTWLTAIKEAFPSETAAQIEADLHQNFADLLRDSPKQSNQQLKIHLSSILPVLALYRALQAAGMDQETARSETQTLFFLTLERNREQQRSLGKLPFAYIIYRAMIRPMMKISFPEEGFQTEWIETSKDRLAFNMTGCFYLDTLTTLGAPELTEVFCNADDYIYEDVSPHIEWGRKQTMGKGASHCDFRFIRKRY